MEKSVDSEKAAAHVERGKTTKNEKEMRESYEKEEFPTLVFFFFLWVFLVKVSFPFFFTIFISDDWSVAHSSLSKKRSYSIPEVE